MPSTMKPKGWYSRRHQTSEAHDAAREAYLYNRGPAARKRKAQERLARKSETMTEAEAQHYASPEAVEALDRALEDVKEGNLTRRTVTE